MPEPVRPLVGDFDVGGFATVPLSPGFGSPPAAAPVEVEVASAGLPALPAGSAGLADLSSAAPLASPPDCAALAALSAFFFFFFFLPLLSPEAPFSLSGFAA